MDRIRIDLDDLTTALTHHDGEWVLDLQTGEVLMAEWVRDPSLRGDVGLAPEGDESDDAWDEDDPLESDRFRGIEPLVSHEGFRWMERFAEEQDEGVRERLLDALNRSRPFRRFRDTVAALPAIADAWYRYEAERLREEAESWLRAEEIDAELVDKRVPQDPPRGQDG
jgi:hypothetical protein